MSRAIKAVRRADGGGTGSAASSAESRMKDSFRKMEDSFRVLDAQYNRLRDGDQIDVESDPGADKGLKGKKLDPSSRRKTPL